MFVEFFVNFDGNCREAVEYYAKVFKSEVSNLMTYSDAPPDPNHPVAEGDKDKVLYAGVKIGNVVGMFSDTPTGAPFVKGTNVALTVSLDDKDEVKRIYDELSDGGSVIMPLGPTFFSEMFSMFEDKFGVIWQVLYYVQEN